MTLTREGFTLFYIFLALAALGFALALVRRSWPLWLVALTCTVLALGAAYTHRAEPSVARATGVTP